jgi:hypothetical protein
MNPIIKSISIILVVLNYVYSIFISASFAISFNDSYAFPNQEKYFYITNCKQNLEGYISKNENLIVNLINDLKLPSKKIIKQEDFPNQLEMFFRNGYSLYSNNIICQFFQFTISVIIFPFHYFW